LDLNCATALTILAWCKPVRLRPLRADETPVEG
jgi:hypothetical protein